MPLTDPDPSAFDQSTTGGTRCGRCGQYFPPNVQHDCPNDPYGPIPTKEIYMEDVVNIVSKVMSTLEEELKKHKLDMTDKDLDQVHDLVSDMIERLAGYPTYRNYN